MNARASERVDTESNLGIADRRHIDNGAEIADVGEEVVVSMCRWGFKCSGEQHSLDAFQTGAEKVVGFRFDPLGYVRIGRSPVRRIVFEATVVRRIVRRRDYDAVG